MRSSTRPSHHQAWLWGPTWRDLFSGRCQRCDSTNLNPNRREVRKTAQRIGGHLGGLFTFERHSLQRRQHGLQLCESHKFVDRHLGSQQSAKKLAVVGPIKPPSARQPAKVSNQKVFAATGPATHHREREMTRPDCWRGCHHRRRPKGDPEGLPAGECDQHRDHVQPQLQTVSCPIGRRLNQVGGSRSTRNSKVPPVSDVSDSGNMIFATRKPRAHSSLTRPKGAARTPPPGLRCTRRERSRGSWRTSGHQSIQFRRRHFLDIRTNHHGASVWPTNTLAAIAMDSDRTLPAPPHHTRQPYTAPASPDVVQHAHQRREKNDCHQSAAGKAKTNACFAPTACSIVAGSANGAQKPTSLRV
ncbi:MAG: hypothetical protein CM1200mP2_45910 [Planctomycetaceae bacterium]|nr:MAG: hypothetical protein CM1200mP2_45910 [Planctomycetaceae bacterium]